MLHYKQEIPAMTDLLTPQPVGWESHANNPAMLETVNSHPGSWLSMMRKKELVASHSLGRRWPLVIFVQDLCKTRSPALWRIGKKL